MKISFERSGGFMGRNISLSLDLDDLPTDQALTLKRLVNESNFFKLKATPPAPREPDGFTYSITIETETEHHTLSAGDTNFPPNLRPLLENLVERARAH